MRNLFNRQGCFPVTGIRPDTEELSAGDKQCSAVTAWRARENVYALSQNRVQRLLLGAHLFISSLIEAPTSALNQYLICYRPKLTVYCPFKVQMNHLNTFSIRSCSVRPCAMSANNSGRSPQYAGNSVSEVGDKMNGGAVIEERSPVMEARDCGKREQGQTADESGRTYLDEARPSCLLFRGNDVGTCHGGITGWTISAPSACHVARRWKR